MAELVDAHVSGACVERHAGSSPVLGTFSRAGGGIGRHATVRGSCRLRRVSSSLILRTYR